MNRVRSDLGKRNKDEIALFEARMGNPETGSLYYLTSGKKNVNVDKSRPGFPLPRAAHLFFDPPGQDEELGRPKRRFDGGREIEEPRLRGEVNRLSAIDRRHPAQQDAGLFERG